MAQSEPTLTEDHADKLLADYTDTEACKIAEALVEEIAARGNGGRVAVEALTYKHESIPYELTAAINGWQPWDAAYARQFIRDTFEAASPKIENLWYQALVAHDLLDE